MALPKRTPAAAAPAPVRINFGSLSDYSSGGALPEGDYLASDHSVIMWQAQKKDGTIVGDKVLAVQVTFEPPTGATKEEEQHIAYYSMGRTAHQSFAPDPDTGKGLVAVAGGKGGSLNDQSNWAIYLKSLYDSGLPEGVFENDLSVLDGVQVHIVNMPEPESRKQMKALTGEVAAEARQAKTIAVVSEIKEGGAPWEGGGGPIAAAPAAAKPGLRKPPAAAPAAATVAGKKPGLAKKAGPPPPPETAADDTTEEETAFLNSVSTVMEKNAKGCPRMALRTATFRDLKGSVGDEMATSLVDAYFADDAALTAVLNQIGFTLTGTNVTVLAD